MAQATGKIGPATQRFIERSSEFDPQVVSLGRKLTNEIGRRTMTGALAGDNAMIGYIAQMARSKGWLPAHQHNDATTHIKAALEWVRLSRTT